MSSTVPLYVAIARTLDSYRSCVDRKSMEWADKHLDRLVELGALLPSGSGFDAGSRLDLETSTPNRLVIHTAFHHMNDVGMYTRWTDHDVIVTPNLAFGYTVRVTGKDHRDIKEHIEDTFTHMLNTIVPLYSDK